MRFRAGVGALALMGAALAASATGAVSQTNPVEFEDVSEDVGVAAAHNPVIDPEAEMPVYLMTGQAWGDYDNDGWLDLYLTDQMGSNSLWRNTGDGRFERSTASDDVAVGDASSGGAVFVDYDNDGWRDLHVTTYDRDRLFRNESGAGFTDVSDAAGIGSVSEHGTTAAWADYDADGHLDVYVANYGCQPCEATPADGGQDRLYHNDGDGTFRDVTPAIEVPGTAGFGFAASWFDYDADGDVDLYLVNDVRLSRDLEPNVLLRNDGPGCSAWCFTDVSSLAGAGKRVDGMGVAVDDFDADGNLDLYFTSTGTGSEWKSEDQIGVTGPSVLLRNNGDGTFADVSAQTRASVESITWAPLFFDVDNDADRDLFVAVGAMGNLEDPAGAGNRLLINDAGRFADAAPAAGVDASGDSLGAAAADYDNDGDPDFVIGNIGGGYQLYENVGATAGASDVLNVHLFGDGPVNSDAVGSVVRLTTRADDDATLVQTQQVIAGSALGSGSDTALQFGLGGSRIERLEIAWPDGSSDVFGTDQVEARTQWSYTYGDASPRTFSLSGPGPVAVETGGGFGGWATAIIIAALVLVGIAIWMLRGRIGRRGTRTPEGSAGHAPEVDPDREVSRM